jgi:hypothetical protein
MQGGNLLETCVHRLLRRTSIGWKHEAGFDGVALILRRQYGCGENRVGAIDNLFQILPLVFKLEHGVPAFVFAEVRCVERDFRRTCETAASEAVTLGRRAVDRRGIEIDQTRPTSMAAIPKAGMASQTQSYPDYIGTLFLAGT